MSRLEQKLLRQVARASVDHRLLEKGDRVMVCMSGGKDSFGMLHLLQQIQKKTPFPFDLIAVHLDQGHPNFPTHLLVEHFQRVGVAYEIVHEDTYSIVKEKIPAGKTQCSLCSRLRRGVLYNTAAVLGCTKIALGHHRDDMIETLLLNLFYSGVMKTMPPRLRSDDGRNVVIRPLAYCLEEDLICLEEQEQFPIIPCDLCGSQENLKRAQIKQLIATLHLDNPNVKGNLFHAMKNIRPSHLLDKNLRQAVGLDPDTAEPIERGTHPLKSHSISFHENTP